MDNTLTRFKARSELLESQLRDFTSREIETNKEIASLQRNAANREKEFNKQIAAFEKNASNRDVEHNKEVAGLTAQVQDMKDNMVALEGGIIEVRTAQLSN